MTTERSEPQQPETTGKEMLGNIGNQLLVVDPKYQGFGLENVTDFGINEYANKFFILSNSQGLYISTVEVPQALRSYYGELGVEVASDKNILALPESRPKQTLIDRIEESKIAQEKLIEHKGKYMIPYMLTPEVEESARAFGYETMGEASKVRKMANKARLHEEIVKNEDFLRQETGFEPIIPTVISVVGDNQKVSEGYTELSEGQTKKVVIVKPESASAMGIYIIQPSNGMDEVKSVLENNFSMDDEVMIREFVDHNHSPSAQGVSLVNSDFTHLYLGRQLIGVHEKNVSYDGSQIPFGPETVEISAEQTEMIRRLSEIMGQHFVKDAGISGISGFDAVVNLRNGEIDCAKVVELNLHFPGSISFFTALNKLYPEGFNGVAHNIKRFPYKNSTNFENFMANNRDLLIKKKGDFGIFPLNASYSDAVDIIVCGENIEETVGIAKKIT